MNVILELAVIGILGLIAIALILYVLRIVTRPERLQRLEQRVERLERSLRVLQDKLGGMPPRGYQEREPSAPPPAEPAPPARAEPARPAPAAPVPVLPSPAEMPRPAMPPPSRTRAEWEALIGGKWLNRIGALALIIATGLFLKYAFDEGWITEWARVLIGVGFGVALLLLGERFRRKGLEIFSQGLAGCGISILYLSFYASFNLYHLIPQWAALLAMSAVTLIAFQQAFRYDSLAVSVLGWAGGFLTPAMLSTGQVNEIGLFTYILILDIGLLAVLVKKDRWAVLEPLTLGATYLTYSLWYTELYRPDSFAAAVVFVSLFWALFHALDAYRAFRGIESFGESRHLVAALNGLFYFLAIYALVNRSYPDWSGLVVLSIGTAYLWTGLWIQSRQADAGMMRDRHYLAALVLLVAATAIQLSGFLIIVFWSLEAMALCWCGFRWKQPRVSLIAFGLLVFSFFVLYGTNGALQYRPITDFALVFNLRFLAFAVLAAGLWVSDLLQRRTGEQDGTDITSAGLWAWNILLFTLATVETNDYFRKLMAVSTGETEFDARFVNLIALAAVWATGSVLLVLYGYHRKAAPAIYAGLALLALSVLLGAGGGCVFNPVRVFVPVLNLRFVVFLLVIGALLLHADLLRRKGGAFRWRTGIISLLQIAAVLMVFELITVETWDFCRKAILVRAGDPAEIERLRNLQQLAVSGIWLLYSVVLMTGGLWRRKAVLRIISLALFGITILKIFLFDLSFLETPYRIVSFFGLGLILLVVSYLYQRYRSIILNAAPSASQAPRGDSA